MLRNYTISFLRRKVMKCLNVIVYYDNPKEIKSYISECLLNSSNVDIGVVINSDKKHIADELLNTIQENTNRVHIYNFGENVGYLNSLLKVLQNQAYRDYEYYILSNTDISYETLNFYEKLVLKQYKSDIGCIAPSVYSEKSNSFSNPHYKNRTSKKKFKMLSVLFSSPVLGKLYLKLAEMRSKKHSTNDEEDSCYVYSPHGCFMIFTKDFIQKIYGYLYGVTLYSEEACVGELLLRSGKKCFFDNTLRVRHLESTVTGKINYKRRFKYWKKSIDYILKEFY